MASVCRASIRTPITKLWPSTSVVCQGLQKVDYEAPQNLQNGENLTLCHRLICIRINPKSPWQLEYSRISSRRVICCGHFEASKFYSTASSAEFQFPEGTDELTTVLPAETEPKLNENRESRYEIRQRLHEQSNEICEIIEKHADYTENSLNRLGLRLTPELVRNVLSNLSSANSALRFFMWAKTQPGFKPNSVVYDELVNIVGRSKDFDTLQMLLSDRITEGCFNSARTFSFATAWHGDPVMLKRLTEVINKLQSFHRKNAYDMLIAALCKENYVDRALSVLQEMFSVGCALNTFTFHPLVIAYCRNNRIEKAKLLFQVMKGRDCSPDLTCYNFVLGSLCRKGRFPEAVELLGIMINSPGCKPNAVTYDTLIIAACKAGKVEGALGLFHRMKEDGLKPLYCTYTNLISGLLKAGGFDKAYELVNEDSGKDPALDFSSYSFLARSCSKLGKVQEARQVLMEMKAKNLKPDDQLCNEVLGRYMLSQAT